MDKTLRILMLEDNPADAELIQFELLEAGIAFEAKVVNTQEDFVQGIDAFRPGLILSDYDLPRYSGAEALDEANRRCPDVPFILVTGAVTEERAIQILTSGAKDFVMKNRLGKIVPAVLRARAEAEEQRARRKAEEELRAASLYSRSLIEASLDPFVTISPDGKVTDVNWATEQATGVPREQIIGTDFAEYFTDPQKARRGYQEAFAKGSVKDLLLALRHFSGRITEVLYNATTYTDEKGGIRGVFAAARDVTQLRKTEEELRRANQETESRVARRTAELKAVLDAAPIAVWIARDPQCLEITGNAYADELIGAPRGSNISRSAADAAVSYKVFRDGVELNPGEMPAQVVTATARPMVEQELEILLSDGRRVHLLESAVPLFDSEGRVRGAVVTGADITRRRQMEDQLRQNEERQRLVLEASSLGTFEVDLVTGEARWNETEFELLGLKPGDLPAGPDTFFRHVHPDDLAMMSENWEKAKLTGVLDAECRVVRADGQERWVAAKGRFLFAADSGEGGVATGEALRFLGVNFDITKRKRAEQEARDLLAAVRREKERLSALINSIEDEIWFADTQRRFTLANPPAVREFKLEAPDGPSIGELLASLDVRRPDGSPRPLDESPALTALAGQIVRKQEEIVRTPATDAWHYRQVNASPVRDGSGGIVGSVSVVRDVTEEKRMEEALRKSREEYRQVVENAGSVILKADGQLRITFMNRYGLEFFGYQAHEIIGKSALGTIIPYEDTEGHDIAAMAHDLIVHPERYAVNVHQNRRKDGRLVWMSWTNKPLYDERGNLSELLVIGNDLSPFKENEENAHRPPKED